MAFSLSIFDGDVLLGRHLDWPLPLLLLLKLLFLGWMKGAAVWFQAASILRTVGGEAVNGSSLPIVASCGVTCGVVVIPSMACR